MIGTDILYIPRLKKVISKYPNFIKKVYSEEERKLALKYKDPIYFYATRFAAKEAIIKASNGKFDFKDIELLKKSDGRPIAHIIDFDSILIDISLSFDNEYAICFCQIKNNVDKTLF